MEHTAPSAQRSGRTYYLNGANNDLGYEKEIKDNGLVEHKHYLSAGGMVFAMQVTRAGNLATGGAAGTAKPIQSLQYLHQDHLGSVAVVTDEQGDVIERLAYDPWGKRRFPNGTADTTDSIVGLTLDRGFTMHEHLDEMGVIHMNGRIYDPLIGRFMSADPFIQAPENLQSHNRFAYVMNNPLNMTDPSGFISKKFKKIFRAVAAIAIGYFTGGLVSGLLQSGAGLSGSAFFSVATSSAAGAIAPGLTALGGAVAGAAGGFAAGLVGSGGDLKAGLLGAFSGGVFGGIGGLGLTGSSAVAAHAAGGCITSVASGGQCGSGALSAAFGKFATIQTQDWGLGVAQFTASTVAGGIGSAIGGGKFENGAVTAAFGYLFNHCMTGRSCWEQAAEGFVKAWQYVGEKYISASTTVLGLVTMVPSGGGTAVVATTIHGAERLAGAAATRGGVLSVDQAAVVQASGRTLTQADGAAVKILENPAGRFDIVVSGERGIITTFNNIRQKSMDRLAERYGWK